MNDTRCEAPDKVRLWTNGEVFAWRDYPVPQDVLDAMARLTSAAASEGPVTSDEELLERIRARPSADSNLIAAWVKNQRLKYGSARPLDKLKEES